MRELLRYLEEAAPEPGSAAWLAGVRKWWAQWVQGAAKVAKIREPGERPQVRAWFAEGEQRIAALKDALVRAPGLWTLQDLAKQVVRDIDYAGMGGPGLKLPAKVLGHKLAEAPHMKVLPYLEAAMERLRKYAHTEETWFRRDYPATEADRAHAQLWGGPSKPEFGAGRNLNAWQALAESVVEVDREVQAALRVYAQILKRTPLDVERRVAQAVPLEYSLGRVRVLTDPGAAVDLRYMAWTEGGSGAAQVDAVTAQAVHGGLQQAQRALEARGFGALWRGLVYVVPAQQAHEYTKAKSGERFRSGGHYAAGGDAIMLNPRSGWSERDVAELAVHELGHRYWYKVMKAGARERFAAWFDPRTKAQQDAAGPQAGYVPAPTAYGAESPVEEFAEVFAAYVLGRYNGIELTGPQRARFEALARGRAAQSEERTMRGLLRRLEESERGTKAALTRLNRAAEQQAGTERFAEQAMEELLTAIVQRAKDGGYYHLKLGSSTAQKAYNEGWKMVREALSALGKAGQGEDGGGIDAAMFALRRAKDAFYRVFVLIAKDADNKSDLSLINGIRDEIDAAWETARLSLGM